MERPKPEPLVVSAQNIARDEIRLKASVKAQTAFWKRQKKKINKNSKPIRLHTETNQCVRIWFNKNQTTLF